jgi:hypothetical protein
LFKSAATKRKASDDGKGAVGTSASAKRTKVRTSNQARQPLRDD